MSHNGSDTATGAHLPNGIKPARKKWTSAFRVVQSMTRFKNIPTRHHYPIDERSNSNESTPSRDEPDPVYLALKQATGKYSSPRGSHIFDSATPSPRNLSQASLQDSGYAETSGSRSHLLGSTPQLDQSGQQQNGYATGRPRAPKLHKQMKSLSLDCADAPPPMPPNGAMRSPFKTKPLRQARGYANSGDMTDLGRSVSPTSSPRRLPLAPRMPGTHIVTHEYIQSQELVLYLGDRLHIVDNGDPDWLHGFKVNDRTEQLLTFPTTCVAAFQPGEQPMKLTQNVLTQTVNETKLRLYRDQVVFAQPDSIRDGKVMVRNEHGALANCPLTHLMLL